MKNVHIGKLDGIANKYNNKYHRTIKMKPVDAKPSMTLIKQLMILLEYQNIKIFLQKAMFQIGQKKFL